MKKVIVLVLGVTLLGMGLAYAQQSPSTTQSDNKPVDVGNKICPVSGDVVAGSKMGDKPVTIEYNGKIYHLCCPMCIKSFKNDPAKYIKIVEDELKAEKK